MGHGSGHGQGVCALQCIPYSSTQVLRYLGSYQYHAVALLRDEDEDKDKDKDKGAVSL